MGKVEPPRKSHRTRAVFFGAHPGPPWECAFCHTPIHERGRGSQSLVIHHVDEDPLHDVLWNLQSMHRRCHVLHHKAGVSELPALTRAKSLRMTGVRHSPERRARQKARSRLPENRERLSRMATELWTRSDVREKRVAALRGQTRTAEQRERISLAQRVEKVCTDCGGVFVPSWMTRHKTAGKCKTSVLPSESHGESP